MDANDAGANYCSWCVVHGGAMMQTCGEWFPWLAALLLLRNDDGTRAGS